MGKDATVTYQICRVDLGKCLLYNFTISIYSWCLASIINAIPADVLAVGLSCSLCPCAVLYVSCVALSVCPVTCIHLLCQMCVPCLFVMFLVPMCCSLFHLCVPLSVCPVPCVPVLFFMSAVCPPCLAPRSIYNVVQTKNGCVKHRVLRSSEINGRQKTDVDKTWKSLLFVAT